MAEKLPYPIFDRPPLAEAPQTYVPHLRPAAQEVVSAYNRGYSLLLEREEPLQARLLNGDFNPLGKIAAKLEAGGVATPEEEELMSDFRTLLDTQAARSGRKILNTARLVEEANRQEANGIVLLPGTEELRDRYQAGDFHLIEGFDFPLTTKDGTSRFIVPITDTGKSFAILDGAPVEGILSELDRRITGLKTGSGSRLERFLELRRLRHDRDVLHTYSSPTFSGEGKIDHARTQYEAYLKSVNPLLTEWELPDWYKAELTLEDRRVLNIPGRGGNRWWPLLLAIPLGLLLIRACEPAPVVPVVPVVPAPVTLNPCSEISGGNLRFEFFDLSKDPNPSSRGATEREMAYQRMDLDQRGYRPNDDRELVATVSEMEANEPGYVQAYLDAALEDHRQTAQRIRGDKDSNEFIKGTDFGSDFAVLASCTDPSQRDQVARNATNR